MEHTYGKIVKKFCEELHLPKPHAFCQDWEIEVADLLRIQEFINYYQEKKLNNREKEVLMEIIINSCDDALQNGTLNENNWRKVAEILIVDRDIHDKTIDYWILEDVEDKEECFVITPLIRRVKEEIMEIESIEKELFDM